MAKKEGRAQRAAIIVIGILFIVTTAGGIIVSIMQNNEQVQQDQQLQEILKQQQAQQQLQQKAAKKAKDAYLPKGEVTKLQITDVKTGSGKEVKEGDSITVAYRGTLASDGTIFDESKKATFTLADGQLIDGWVQGMPGMKVGGKRRLVIPANLAYGDQAQSGIPANSALVFEIELKAIGGGQ